MSKGIERTKKRFAGIDERDLTNNQSGVPCTYFAGVAKLNCAPLMTQIITKTKSVGGK